MGINLVVGPVIDKDWEGETGWFPSFNEHNARCPSFLLFDVVRYILSRLRYEHKGPETRSPGLYRPTERCMYLLVVVGVWVRLESQAPSFKRTNENRTRCLLRA